MDDKREFLDLIPAPDEGYRNYKEERRNRQIAFRPSSAGTIRYQRVPMCGHKLVAGVEPRHRNCQSCWFVTFNLHKDLVESCDQVFKQFGEKGLSQIKGPKFAKNFTRFMSTLAQWQQATKLSKETDGEDSITAASGSDGDAAAVGAGESISEQKHIF